MKILASVSMKIKFNDIHGGKGIKSRQDIYVKVDGECEGVNVNERVL